MDEHDEPTWAPLPDEPTWVPPAVWGADHSVTRQTVHNLITEGLFAPGDVMKVGRATRLRRDAVPRQRRAAA